MPYYEVDEQHVKIPAGWMIEQTGWKGKSLGNAAVYDKQALILVNLGNATGADIVALSEAVCRDVASQFGIEIHPEVNFIE
jgi:UDP-N-acetylmuramate dehydrogenase